MAKADAPKEQLFCYLYVALRSPREAALRAGYPADQADEAAAALLARPDIQERIETWTARGDNPRELALQTLTRLALGSCNDAVRLALQEEADTRALDKLDLFAVAEIKYGKGGVWEIKLQDRLAAVRLLLEQSPAESGSLLEAIRASAEAAQKDDA